MSKFVRKQLRFGQYEEYFEHNGVKEGIYKEYHSIGQLAEICTYVNGQREGNFKLL